MYGVRLAHRAGFVAKCGWGVIAIPVAVALLMAAVIALLMWSNMLISPNFSLHVAAAAIVAAKVCVRAGLLAAVFSVSLTWLLFGSGKPGFVEAAALTSAIVVVLLLAPKFDTTKPRADRPGAELPFVSSKNDTDHTRTANCWNVESSGDYGADDLHGKALGRLWIGSRTAGDRGVPPLSFIVGDMVNIGKFGGVEAGFMSAVESAVAGLRVDLPLLIADHKAYNLRT